MITGTQDVSEDDHLRDAGQTADMIEEADRCQQPQGSGERGFGDNPDLHDFCSPPDDQFVESHQTPSSSAVPEGKPNGHQWLLRDPTPGAGQTHQLQKAASQQLHHDRIAEVQHAHQAHKSFHRELQGRGTIQRDGYQSMHGQRAFDPSSVQKHIGGISLGGNTLGHPTMGADPAIAPVAVRLLHHCQRSCVTFFMRPAVRFVRCLFKVCPHRPETDNCVRSVHTAAKMVMLHYYVLQRRMVSGMCQPVQTSTLAHDQQLATCICRCKTLQLCLV